MYKYSTKLMWVGLLMILVNAAITFVIGFVQIRYEKEITDQNSATAATLEEIDDQDSATADMPGEDGAPVWPWLLVGAAAAGAVAYETKKKMDAKKKA